MEENEVIKTIRDVIKEKRRDFMFGEYVVSADKVVINKSERGGVYGIAVKLENDEAAEAFYQKICESKSPHQKINCWRTIGNGYYPLYWGKDINLGFRLYEHATGAHSSASAHLATRGLHGYSVIYGAVFCEDKEFCEKKLRCEYPDILKSYKG